MNLSEKKNAEFDAIVEVFDHILEIKFVIFEDEHMNIL